MTAYNSIRLIDASNASELKKLMADIGVSPEGASHMADKGEFLYILAENLSCPAAIVLKQEMLSIGGEAACHAQVITHNVERSSALLMGTRRQLNNLATALRTQPFSLKNLGENIIALLNCLDKSSFTLPYPGGSLTLGGYTAIMGILNLTPDSFSDGGRHNIGEDAVSHALAMAEAGANIIDIGGESTRPGYKPISADTEKERILETIRRIAARTNTPISVDTYKPQVAEAALDAGAVIINDVGGPGRDRLMYDLAAGRQAPLVIMYWADETVQKDADIMDEMCRYFLRALNEGKAAGMKDDQFILDPGLGFEKTPAQDILILRRLRELKSFGMPILVGPSQKKFIGKITGLEVAERGMGTAAAITMAAEHGAHIVRVHHAAAMRSALKVADAVIYGFDPSE